MSAGDSKEHFENVFRLVGGHRVSRFQYFALAQVSLQLILMTWNHLGYIFMGAVPNYWCHVTPLENSSWTIQQIQNLSLPKEITETQVWKYDQCHYFNLDYSRILQESGGNFERAYQLVHNDDNESSLSSPPADNGSGLQKCTKWRYDTSIYQSTIVTQFDLVCGRRYLVASIQALYMIGALMGTLIFGPLNDRILGRRRTLLVSIVLCLVGGILTAFSTSYWMLVGSRFLVAIGTAGTMLASSIWFLEHCDTRNRARLYCINGSFFGVGYAMLPLYAYFFRTWNHLQLAFTCTMSILLGFYWTFPESPRWLASHGRDSEAVDLLEKMARFNKVRPLPTRAELLKYVRRCHTQKANSEAEAGESKEAMPLSPANSVPLPEKRKPSKSRVLATLQNFAALLSTPQLRHISGVMWCLFVTVAFVYYGFAFSTASLTTNPYLVVSLGALMEIPAAVVPIPFLSSWGRRPTVIACYLFTGLAALAIAITPAEWETVRTLLSMTGKLFVASVFTVLYLVVGEVYPTMVRSTGQAMSTLMGRFGSIAAPYVADMLTTVYPDLPSVIFGIVALVGAVVAFLIPEMKDAHMKDQVYEYEVPAAQQQPKQRRNSNSIKLEFPE